MINGFVLIAVERFLAVVTVTTVGVMSAADADAAADVPRRLVQLHVEATLTRVQVALARCIQHVYTLIM